MARSDRIRFAFALPRKGDHPWVSGSWRVWVHRDTVYIADKQVPAWKVSLHGEDAWRLAVAKEAMNAAASPLPPDHDRAPWTFEPTPFVDGMRRAFVIATAAEASIRARARPTGLRHLGARPVGQVGFRDRLG